MVGYYRLKDIDIRLESGAYVIPASDFNAVEEATRIIETAEHRANEIVDDAQRAYAIEKERGYQEGLAASRLEAVKRLLRESQTLDLALQKLERELAQLVGSCVRKIIYSFNDSERAESVVRQALAKMRKEKRVELRAPPSTFNYFHAEIDRIRSDFPEVELIDVVEDEQLDADQVVIETSIGRVDGNLGRRLDDLTRVLLQSLGLSETVSDLRPEEPRKRPEISKARPFEQESVFEQQDVDVERDEEDAEDENADDDDEAEEETEQEVEEVEEEEEEEEGSKDDEDEDE